ncbi:aminotransferase class I/II-fold pyridoxal phosphate-dependent enzyme [Pantoea agglomerans]|uniref:aminotransferase class I/II-fold pyridoxal phosphate-dependent enzyme n=1 Tax=Enterobacter agglomerans TaxID=549 RepID=UPI00320A88E6
MSDTFNSTGNNSEDNNIYRNTTGTLMLKMKKAGITDVELISQEMDKLRSQQVEAGIFAFDTFTCNGSDALTDVADEIGAESRQCSVWSTNLYLGLNRHPEVIKSVIDAVSTFGTGSGTSAMSGGLCLLHRKIEEKVSNMLNKESVMLFPTGFSANMGALAALCGEEDHVLIDAESHASIRDGIRLSGAGKWITFAHNSLQSLREKLEASEKTCKGKIVVIVESAYSMSGDICPLTDIVKLKDRFNFLLFVDEAHSFGIYGEGGRGLCYREGIIDRVDFITSTFSKATASIGGFVAMPHRYTSYFQWSANAYAFQACFTPGDAAAILAALNIIENDNSIVFSLHEKTRYMRGRLNQAGFDLRNSETPVIPIYINDTEKLIKTCLDLYKRDIFSVPISYPMVSQEDGRIRFIVNARHTHEQIDRTVDALSELAKKNALFSA